MMAYAQLHKLSLLTILFFYYHNDDDTRLMKIQSHDTNLKVGGVEIEWRVKSLSTSDQMESSLALHFL